LHPVVPCEHIVHRSRIWVGVAQAVVHLGYSIWESRAKIGRIGNIVLWVAKQWPSRQE